MQSNPADLKDLKLNEHVCMTPGEYKISAAIYDTKSREVSLKENSWHIPALRHDSLSPAWSFLPSVEIARSCNSTFISRLIPRSLWRKPLLVDLIVSRDQTPSPTLAPRLHILSSLRIPNGTVRVTALDLDHRGVSTQMVHERFDPGRLWEGLPRRTPPGAIDAHVAVNSKGAAQFFASEVRKIITQELQPETDHVVIILAAPRSFSKGADLTPIQLIAASRTTVFYIRNKWRTFPFLPPESLPPDPQDWSTPPELPKELPRPASMPNNADSLLKLVEPLHPQVFNAVTAMEFRHAVELIWARLSDRR
jgi:hypothetical protein